MVLLCHQGTAVLGASTICLCHHSSNVNTYMKVVHIHSSFKLTHKLRLLLLQLFLMVFIKCGGSDIKYKNRGSSLAKIFGTLYTISSLALCSFHNYRFGEAPSHVIPKTRNPILSSLDIASQTGSNIISPLKLLQAN